MNKPNKEAAKAIALVYIVVLGLFAILYTFTSAHACEGTLDACQQDAVNSRL